MPRRQDTEWTRERREAREQAVREQIQSTAGSALGRFHEMRHLPDIFAARRAVRRRQVPSPAVRTLRDIVIFGVAAASFIFGILMVVGGAMAMWESRHVEEWEDVVFAVGFSDVGTGLLLACAGLLVALVNELVVRSDPPSD